MHVLVCVCSNVQQVHHLVKAPSNGLHHSTVPQYHSVNQLRRLWRLEKIFFGAFGAQYFFFVLRLTIFFGAFGAQYFFFCSQTYDFLWSLRRPVFFFVLRLTIFFGAFGA